MRLLFVLLLVAVVVPGQDATTPTFSTGARLVLRAVKVRILEGVHWLGLLHRTLQLLRMVCLSASRCANTSRLPMLL